MNPDDTLSILTAPNTNSRHWTPGTVTWADICSWVDKPADHKACGNYVLGELRPTTVTHKGAARPCTGLHRTKVAMTTRSALTLDVDHPSSDFIDGIELLMDVAAVIHTTYNSAPDEPRYRVIIPLDRDVTPDEYVMIAQNIMQQLGFEQFDPGSDQAERYMYYPSAQQAAWFQSWVLDGPALRADDFIKDLFDVDLRSRPFPEPNRSKRDPFDIDGVVGAFNRAYEELSDLVTEYELPYEYDGDDRWHLVGSRAVAGMGPVPGREGLFFSHHATDPAYGQAHTAFDLVRVHRFGELDAKANPQTPINRLPSYTAMLDLASTDARVTAELVGVDFAAGFDDGEDHSNDWKLGLKFAPRTGELRDTIANWDLIVENDPVFRLLCYNEMTLNVEIQEDLPWRPLEEGGATFGTADRAALAHYIEREYHIRIGRGLLDEMIAVSSRKRYMNPVKEYLTSLEWDGVPRVETCLPGCEDNEYNRMVARKVMTAAVARIMQPGCKWDHTLVLFGDEGIGKSFWVDRMSQGWSATLGRLGDKDTLVTMQRSWILLADEGHSLRKADAEATKEFLTRRVDVLRMPYDREAQSYPRRCVIWSTTNDEVFLRRQQGNRRFLIVRCEAKVDFDALTDSYIDQVWAEAFELWRSGEELFLTPAESRMAEQYRDPFIEEDALAGIIEEYLATLVPEDWYTLSPEARAQWFVNRSEDLVEPGTLRIDKVCSAQIWVEALGRRMGDHKRVDLLEINKVLHQLDGWELAPARVRVPGYGPQTVFLRIDADHLR